MSDTLICSGCGSDCCIILTTPRRLSPKCVNDCCKFVMKVKTDEVLKAGQLVGIPTGSPQTIAHFDADATDGTQFAVGVVGEDIAADENGLRVLPRQMGPNCDPAIVTVYACGRFPKNEITGDIAAARASGLPITEIAGEVLIGGAA